MLLQLQARNGLGLLPFVPVGVSYNTQPRSGSFGVKVRIGLPLSVPEASLAPALTQAIMAEIALLCQEPHQGPPSSPAPAFRD